MPTCSPLTSPPTIWTSRRSPGWLGICRAGGARRWWSTTTWEVVDGAVLAREGGYSDWVFARAERLRLDRAAEDRRKNLARKELAWLRRGPPARTSKPRY